MQLSGLTSEILNQNLWEWGPVGMPSDHGSTVTGKCQINMYLMNQYKNNQERGFIVSAPSLHRSGKGRKTYRNPEKRDSAEASGIARNVNDIEFELNVGIKEVTFRSQSMNKSSQIRKTNGASGGLWQWRHYANIVTWVPRVALNYTI